MFPWNAPRFHTLEHVATMGCAASVACSGFVHLEAKTRAMPPGAVQDPAGLPEWSGPDRACVSFESTGAAAARPLQDIIQQWRAHLPLPSGT